MTFLQRMWSQRKEMLAFHSTWQKQQWDAEHLIEKLLVEMTHLFIASPYRTCGRILNPSHRLLNESCILYDN